MSNAIHMVDWSSQPDLLIRCSGEWTTPQWPQPKDLPLRVHLASNGQLYTFYESGASCVDCRARGPRGPEETKP